jgi:hypothetical protein
MPTYHWQAVAGREEGYVTRIVVKVQEVRDLIAQEDCRRQHQEEQAQWIARVDSAAGMVQQTCRS